MKNEKNKKNKKDFKKKFEKKILPILKKLGLAALMVAFAFATYIALEYIIAYPMIWILGGQKFNTPFYKMFIFNLLHHAAWVAVLILIPSRIKKHWKTSREELGLTELPTFTDIGLSILGFVITILLTSVISSLVSHIVDMNQCQDLGISNYLSSTDRVFVFITLTVIVPIAEELAFRGWLYGKLRKHFSFFPAMLITSAFFGFMHGQWNVAIIVGFMSAIICLERELTGTIYAGILTHMLKNGIAFFLLYVIGVPGC
jgi:hypothetical protein